MNRKTRPDFDQFLKTLRREPTERPVLFEFIVSESAIRHFANPEAYERDDELRDMRIYMQGFLNAGYDFAVVPAWGAGYPNFPHVDQESAESISLNAGAMITDEASLEHYAWPDPDAFDYDKIARLAKELPDGAKFIPCGYGGVLESAILICGFEDLCVMAIEGDEIVEQVFKEVGARLLRFYDNLSDIEAVGAIMHPDDWGFKTQPMLSPSLLAQYVYPWHQKIVDCVHAKGKAALLHSCGNPELVMAPIIDDIGYDGKHSYEDNIIPVEQVYERWGERIAILGGIDVHFLATSTPDEVYRRCVSIVEKTMPSGGYALGAGNSITDYVPVENYVAMLKAAEDVR